MEIILEFGLINGPNIFVLVESTGSALFDQDLHVSSLLMSNKAKFCGCCFTYTTFGSGEG